MKQESLTLAGHAASGLTVGISGVNKLGWFEFISVNASGISVIIGFCSLIFAICFYVVSSIKSSQTDRNKIEIDNLSVNFSDHKEETTKQFDHVNSGINSILDKLG